MNRIKELRTERKMKQAELAQLLSCTPTAISNYETGFRSPDIETIHKLCDIFGCTADYLLGRSDPVTRTIRNAGNLDNSRLPAFFYVQTKVAENGE